MMSVSHAQTANNPTPTDGTKRVVLKGGSLKPGKTPFSLTESFVVLMYNEGSLKVSSVYGTTLNPSAMHLSIYTKREDAAAVYQGELNTLDDYLPVYLDAGTYTVYAQPSLTEVYSGTLVVE